MPVTRASPLQTQARDSESFTEETRWTVTGTLNGLRRLPAGFTGSESSSDC
jgi:hypothetical protein